MHHLSRSPSNAPWWKGAQVQSSISADICETGRPACDPHATMVTWAWFGPVQMLLQWAARLCADCPRQGILRPSGVAVVRAPGARHLGGTPWSGAAAYRLRGSSRDPPSSPRRAPGRFLASAGWSWNKLLMASRSCVWVYALVYHLRAIIVCRDNLNTLMLGWEEEQLNQNH